MKTRKMPAIMMHTECSRSEDLSQLKS